MARKVNKHLVGNRYYILRTTKRLGSQALATIVVVLRRPVLIALLLLSHHRTCVRAP